jgi:hypothetical protein
LRRGSLGSRGERGRLDLDAGTRWLAGGRSWRRLLRRCLLRRGLLGGCGLFGLDRPAETLTVGLAAGAVGLRVLDGGRVALHTHPEGQAEVERLLVRQAELMGKLVDPDLLRQRSLQPFC